MSRFDEFWKIYPKRVNKKQAKTLWTDKGLDSLADMIIGHVTTRVKDDEQWLKGYIVGPEVFLRNEKWEDEYEVKKQFKQQAKVFIDPSVPTAGLLGAARYYDVCTEGLTIEQIEKLIWAKRLGGIHLQQIPESSRDLLENVKPPF